MLANCEKSKEQDIAYLKELEEFKGYNFLFFYN